MAAVCFVRIDSSVEWEELAQLEERRPRFQVLFPLWPDRGPLPG